MSSLSAYRGDAKYSVDCTGNCVVGDQVRFDRAIFSGVYPNTTFAGFTRITGTIIRDSYGAEKQQHTFTIELSDGSTTRIKGRNLYRNRVYRKRWTDEFLRDMALAEKYARGARARQARRLRKMTSRY